MKLQSTLTASLLAIAAALSFNASAASDTSTDVKPEAKAEIKADAQGDAKTEKAAARKKIKPHSHMEEKSGIAAKSEVAIADETKPKKLSPANDKSKHFHPRDGK